MMAVKWSDRRDWLCVDLRDWLCDRLSDNVGYLHEMCDAIESGPPGLGFSIVLEEVKQRFRYRPTLAAVAVVAVSKLPDPLQHMDMVISTAETTEYDPDQAADRAKGLAHFQFLRQFVVELLNADDEQSVASVCDDVVDAVNGGSEVGWWACIALVGHDLWTSVLGELESAL